MQKQKWVGINEWIGTVDPGMKKYYNTVKYEYYTTFEKKTCTRTVPTVCFKISCQLVFGIVSFIGPKRNTSLLF